MKPIMGQVQQLLLCHRNVGDNFCGKGRLSKISALVGQKPKTFGNLGLWRLWFVFRIEEIFVQPTRSQLVKCSLITKPKPKPHLAQPQAHSGVQAWADLPPNQPVF